MWGLATYEAWLIDRKMIKDQFSKNKLNEAFLLQYIQGTKGCYLAILEPNSLKEIQVEEG